MWLPRRRKKSVPAVVYNADGPTLTIQLQESIGVDSLRATLHDYPFTLGQREDLPEQLKLLLAELFCRVAIVNCKVEFGTRLVLGLATHDRHGRELLAGRRLEHFQDIFGSITGQPMAVVWQSAGPTYGAFGSEGGGIDGAAVAQLIGAAARGALEVLNAAAAIRILNGKD